MNVRRGPSTQANGVHEGAKERASMRASHFSEIIASIVLVAGIATSAQLEAV